MKKNLLLIGSILVCQMAGVIGSFATVSSVNTWYVALAKPFFTPPGWVFGPVWILLYTLMGIALFLVIKTKKTDLRKTALIFFFGQLILNALWSLIFFGIQDVTLAFINILLLLLLVCFTILFFFRIHKTAGWLLIPYLLWGTFATVLNGAILILN
ncbi:MAG: Integral membrane protein [Candidatus Uhrbacteria bacterium GW2011_GWE2_40_58]|nr:MAG: Integral membrane protein [Candidatus Uhrbacteria bacterium GW2011_GWF2_40_263]KKR67767.1 MAG: Integral membrane protein [Candidatus Uhrbacteria bacterium GW2011_GWE2_40_58]OGL92207.1 MAG: TspO protein [Candidatus Uhrbacteria bacterium RIFOXYA2_FULL_40_9]OGL96742.1 MAG: TspO protein [Candidatus Uhrbacteria bacterium RIFOXYB2_FULL_41_18]